jgi:hypothetical protein
MPRSPVPHRTFRRGILELSPSEARHLASHPLTLKDDHDRLIVLPAGTGHMDEIILPYNGRPVVLTVHLQGKLDSNRLRSITDNEHHPFSQGRFTWH